MKIWHPRDHKLSRFNQKLMDISFKQHLILHRKLDDMIVESSSQLFKIIPMKSMNKRSKLMFSEVDIESLQCLEW